MALSSRIKTWLNRGLARCGVKLETLTKDRTERDRLLALDAGGHFNRPALPLLGAMKSADPTPLLEALLEHRARFENLVCAGENPVGYRFDNEYFSSPDAEVLYCVIRWARPKRIVEVGCGYSTRVCRLAVMDGGLDTWLCCIDPAPRNDLHGLADEHIAKPIEQLDYSGPLASLEAGDILFIDSSHELSIANDMVFLYLQVLPRLASGVLVHIHDVFLPFDYPRDWVLERGMSFNEQYLVQALLQGSDQYEILWAAYYLQRTMRDFNRYFAHLGGRRGQSLWLRTR